MSIQQEEILIKEFTSGTTITYFSTHLPFNKKLQNVTSTPPELIPTIVHLNSLSQVMLLSTFDGSEIWTLDDNNIYTQDSIYTLVTGYSFSIEENTVISDNQASIIQSSFIESMNLTYNALTQSSVSDSGLDFSGTSLNKVDYVFTKNSEIDDFYVNIKLNRTTSTLDTFNVYNNLTNTTPTQDSETGVVFGRLMALQTLKDSEGNNIRIPLRNVPVGVFNASDDYPTSSSVSDNGDRIFLNLKEGANQSDYFNIDSFNFDKNELLRTGSEFSSVPEQYKYITKTNDEGEFVLYDIPIGTQIVVFEVDLLKQGLTRDEIALNFFPFPPDEDAILDQIPNFSFKQFPINVVPSWGTIQTGYTELDVVVNMDLRKWTTYFIPPVSTDGGKLEASVANNASKSLKVGVRNMAKQGYPNNNIKMVVIPNDLDKVDNQQLNWNLEFAQVRSEAEFLKFGASIIKLPANIYDPNAYKTDKDGVPMERPSQKGVWLSAYQLKLFTNSDANVSRKSGGFRKSSTEVYSHYDVNYTSDNIISQNTSFESGMNIFPYEKPWSTEYPEIYSIPSKPTQEKFISNSTNGRTPTSTGEYWLSEPSFSDGDMVGNLVNSEAGGFGMLPTFDIWVPTRIANSITKSYMYRYESGVAINEEYANGFQPLNPDYPDFQGTSKVVNGEKYQRLECGYGYFCRPQGWPRVARYIWGGGGEAYYRPDVTHNKGLVGDTSTPSPGVTGGQYSDGLWSGPPRVNDIYNIDTQNPALAFDRNSILKNGGIDFYRVIDSSKENLAPIKPFVIPTYTLLHTCDGVADRIAAGGYFSLQNIGEIEVKIPYFLSIGSGTFSIWTPTQGFHTGVSILRPGDTLYVRGFQFGINLEAAMQYTSILLPGNSRFDASRNRYVASMYNVGVTYDGSGGATYNVSANMNADTTANVYWLKTYHYGGGGGLSSIGINTRTCSTNGTCNTNFEIADMKIENNNSVLQT